MPDTSNRGVNWPQAWRFQGLLDQSEKTSAGLAAGAGIAKRFGEAGAMLKSLAGMAFVDSADLPAVAVLVSFCCAQIGRAIRTPIAAIAHHLRIVSSMNGTTNPLNFLRRPLIGLSEHAGWQRKPVRSKPLASPDWGRFHTSLASNGSSGELKLVAADERIFHKFLILQAIPLMSHGASLMPAPLPNSAPRLAIHSTSYGCLCSVGLELDRANPVHSHGAAAHRAFCRSHRPWAEFYARHTARATRPAPSLRH